MQTESICISLLHYIDSINVLQSEFYVIFEFHVTMIYVAKAQGV